jgi:hypothetical protein
MKNAEAILLMKFNSSLNPENLMKTCMEDLADFRNVPGLLQKYYISEESTGAISGFYIFGSKEARDSFWKSALARNITSRYGVLPDTLRVEQYEMAIVLNEELFA